MSTEPDLDWANRLNPEELKFCIAELDKHSIDDVCVTDYRAARAWKGTDIRRFKKCRSCCGSEEWVAYRWNLKKLKKNKFILGYNYGH